MHAPLSVPSAAFDDKRLLDLLHHYAGLAGGRGRGDDILRIEGINLGGHADATVADIIAAGYPYDQWAGHFYQAMTAERFVKLGIEAARLQAVSYGKERPTAIGHDAAAWAQNRSAVSVIN